MSETPTPRARHRRLPGKRRPRWIELATSADHKDVGRILIGGALGFLFIALIELLLMRLQLAIPENTFLSPVAFNRMLSIYGGDRRSSSSRCRSRRPLLLRGARCRSAPAGRRCRGSARSALALWSPARPCSTPASSSPRRRRASTRCRRSPSSPSSPTTASTPGPSATGLAMLGFVLIAIDLVTTLRHMRAPGMAWRRLPVFAWAAADRLLAAARDRPDHAGGADDADDRPQLRRRLLRRRLRRRAAALAAPELDLLHRRLHAGPDLRARRDRRNRRRLLRQAAASTAAP